MLNPSPKCCPAPAAWHLLQGSHPGGANGSRAVGVGAVQHPLALGAMVFGESRGRDSASLSTPTAELCHSTNSSGLTSTTPRWGSPGTRPARNRCTRRSSTTDPRFHILHRYKHASLAGNRARPKPCYFPPQTGNHPGETPYTLFGLRPEPTRQQVIDNLEALLRAATARSPSPR